ncbi:MAG TPA: hypothetical protein VFA45_16445 [Actinomycetes bacterium]|nr:hypothetical protein [Actinomycetes bacterium]
MSWSGFGRSRLAVFQVALVMLARARVSAWLARPRPWAAVIAVGSMAMTVYLWHLTAMILVLGLGEAALGKPARSLRPALGAQRPWPGVRLGGAVLTSVRWLPGT